MLATLDGYDAYISIGNSGFVNGVQVIVAPELYTRLTGSSVWQEINPSLQDTADRPAFDAQLAALAQRLPGTTWLSYEEADRQTAESFAQIRLLGWGLILFIGLIGILNIINTVYTNIHTRINEIGIQRAIGLDTGGLYPPPSGQHAGSRGRVGAGLPAGHANPPAPNQPNEHCQRH